MWIEEYFGDGSIQYIEFKDPPQNVVDKLKESTGQTTYPFIYCGDTFIGGYNELNDYHRTTEILKIEYEFDPDF